MRDYIQPIAATLLLAAACTAFGAGGGSMPSTGSMHSTPSLTPQEQARVFYNDGVSALEKADALLVHDEGKPSGVLTRQDLLGFLAWE